MTNKPMLSVERELLERFAKGSTTGAERRELRALLDKPACTAPSGKTCPGDGVGACKKCPAAKQQGEPVAWLAQAIGKDGEIYRNAASPNEITLRDVGFAWGQGVIDRFTIVIKPLYAEQTAPVAVKVSWADVEPWYNESEQMLRDVCKFEGLKGVALEVWRAARLNGVKP